jgi:NMD protein affecting ribosome stability and mRNA decay
MKRAACCDCGKSFMREADEEWRVRCVPCYKKSKRAESTPVVIESGYWIDRAAAAESKAAALQMKVMNLETQVNNLIGQSLRRPEPSRLDRELAENWRALIQLAHPDKHGGSQGATRMTQWLNEIKGRLPCA